MSSRGQPTPPFNSPYQHAIRPTTMLHQSTYPSPARSDSEPSKYAADGLGLYSFSHPFATSGPSVTSGLYPPSPQPTEAWSHLSTGPSPLLSEATTDPWQENYDHQAPRSPPAWDPHSESHRSSLSSPRGLSIFSRDGSELTFPQIKAEGGSEWASDEESSPPMSHPVPMTVSPESLSAAIFPYEQHAYGTPQIPRFESNLEDPYRQDYEPLSHEAQPQVPLSRHSSTGATPRTRVRRAPNTGEKAGAHVCEQCDKAFPRRFNYKSHLLTHDPNRIKDHKCPHRGCEKRFVRKTDLERHHNSVHLKHKSFKCAKCGHCFARKDTLRRHEEDGCPRRLELTDLPHDYPRTRPMRTGVAPTMPYYHSPQPGAYDARSSPYEHYSGAPGGY